MVAGHAILADDAGEHRLEIAERRCLYSEDVGEEDYLG